MLEHLIRMPRDVAPNWPSLESDATYRVDFNGDPDTHCAMTMGAAQGRGARYVAMAATAMRGLNAIPFMVDAPPGLLTSQDIQNTLRTTYFSEPGR